MSSPEVWTRRGVLRLGLGALLGAAGGFGCGGPGGGNEPASGAGAAGGTATGAGVAGGQAAGTASGADELWKMSALDLGRAIRDGEVSSREVVEAHLGRIAEVNDRVNAITRVLADEALAAADAADQALAGGEEVGPFHGVPMTVKENIDLVGSATTQGVPALAEVVPPADSPRMQQIKAAGAIPIGRTNMPDFGLRWHTESYLHGPTLNPWDASRTPGGSSGGDAVALATGMTPLGNGNDYGGSLRYPAQCCGIASIRPSLGRVAFATSTSPGDAPLTVQMFAVEGPMARHVADVRAALAAISGPDPRDPWWVPAPLEGPPVPRPIRVAVTLDPGEGDVDPAVADGVRRAAQVLEEAGWAVEEVEPPAIEEASALWTRLVVAELRSVLLPDVGPMISEQAQAFLDAALAEVPPADASSYMQDLAARNGVHRQWSTFFERYPLVLGPVSTQQPFPVGHDLTGEEAGWGVLRSMRLVVACNLLGLPAAVAPVGVAEGLPQAVQIIGSRYREDLCLDAAAAIEEALGVLTPIDPVIA